MIEIQNSLKDHYIQIVRDKNTSSDVFRNAMKQLSLILFVEFGKSLKTQNISIETPLENTESKIIAESIMLIPILRAGLVMADAISSICPNPTHGHIAIARDEISKKPQLYYEKMASNLTSFHCIICDPMLATGGSACMTIQELKKRGAKKISFLSIIAAPEGILKVETEANDVFLMTCQIDRELDDKAFIRPGLGDAGDRIYNT